LILQTYAYAQDVRFQCYPLSETYAVEKKLVNATVYLKPSDDGVDNYQYIVTNLEDEAGRSSLNTYEYYSSSDDDRDIQFLLYDNVRMYVSLLVPLQVSKKREFLATIIIYHKKLMNLNRIRCIKLE
jgi:hypothetical protein